MEIEKFKLQNQLNDKVVSKYKQASGIANSKDIILFITSGAMKLGLSRLLPGVSVKTICKEIDQWIILNTGKACQEFERGLAMPSCVCVNNMCQYNTSEVLLVAGDLVKIELAVHIDGYVSTCAHTTVVGGEIVKNRAADVICAAYLASQSLLKSIRPGFKLSDLDGTVEKIAKSFNCVPVDGNCSSEMKRFVLDGQKTIQACSNKSNEAWIEDGDVFAINVLVSTGTGKVTPQNPTVFQRNVHKRYNLRLKSSRKLFQEIDHKCGVFPFSLDVIDDEKQAKLGLAECLDNELVFPLPLTVEKKNELIAQYKFTVLVRNEGNEKLNDDFQLPLVHSEYSIEE